MIYTFELEKRYGGIKMRVKKIGLKLISILLTLTVLFSGMYISNIKISLVKIDTVEAATQEEMGNYIRSLIGTPAKEWGNGTGTQCVELPKYYVENFFGVKNKNIATGNGNTLYLGIAALAPDKFDAIKYYDGFVPQVGDIISMYSTTKLGRTAGHAGIVYEVSGNNYKIAEQWNPSGTVRSRNEVVTAGNPNVHHSIIGVARSKASGCACSDSYSGQYIITTQESPLPFRTGHGAGNGKVSGCESIPKGAEVTVTKAGTVSGGVTWAHVSYNGYNGYCNLSYLTRKEDIAPTPVVPSMPSLSISVGTSYSMTTLNWNNCDNTDFYGIRVYKSDGTQLKYIEPYYGTSYSISLGAGSYYASIASVNSNGNYQICGDVNFTVEKGSAVPIAETWYNGHIYAAYDTETKWSQADAVAKQMGGHLVTIASKEENDVVASLISGGARDGYWLGGNDAASEGNFAWTTGESMPYTNWASGEPNDTGGVEDYMEMYHDGTWNDNADECSKRGFVIEVEEQTKVTSGLYNGNEYEVYEGTLTWSEAKAYCEMLGGHLAYIADNGENDFVNDLIASGSGSGYWLGGILRNGTFQWNDGSGMTISNWDSGQPDNYRGIENYLEMWKGGKWNDAPNVEGLGFVCEFENTFSENITAEYKTDTSIGISWTGVRYATVYRIYVNGELFDETTNVNYEISGLDALTSYDIYVEAYKDSTLIGQTQTTSIMTAQKVTFSGSGTSTDPYQIATADDLYCMANMVNDPLMNKGFGTRYYQQVADIDLSEDTFPSIGTDEASFCGAYDGNFYSIQGMNAVNGGLFGQAGQIGGGDSTVIKNVLIKGTVQDSFSANTGGITAKLCGNATIVGCAVMGDVAGTENAGGIVGTMSDSATVRNCYHNGTVSADQTAGGIVGIIENGNITNCYHTVGAVTAKKAGGIAGTVTGTANVLNSFYLKTTADSASDETMNGAIAANAVVMKELAETLGEYFTADQENVNGGYPILIWQKSQYTFQGSGTEKDPYQINSTEDFKQMAEYVNSEIFNGTYSAAHYIQNTDINLNDDEWSAIGKSKELSFKGEYNGNTYYIYGLNAGGYAFGGLFGCVDEGGYIHNVTVYNGSSGSVNGSVGGIAAELLNGGKVEECAFIGMVNGSSGVGGIVGTVSNGGSVKNCYQTGAVNGTTNVGGVVGTVESGQVTIENCYHAGGNVTATSHSGGVTGTISGTTKIANCYYLKANASHGVNNGSNTGAMAVTSNVLKLLSDDLGEGYSENISEYFNEGYPVLEWQDFSKSQNVYYGDVNEDGVVTVADIVLLQKYLLAAKTLSNDQWLAADMNQDGAVNGFDLALLRQEILVN
ncbi:MAG: lectin-like protein [Ruminococcus sp.]|nr:lectin-like protein [Ruminococcus sp.]